MFKMQYELAFFPVQLFRRGRGSMPEVFAFLNSEKNRPRTQNVACL